MSRRALCQSASLCLVAAFTATTAHAANYVRTYLVNDVLLPTSNSQSASYAIDVDGDGFPENNFGQILVALTGAGIDLNGPMDSAVASGSIVHLVRLQSTDVSLTNDPAAQATWCIGVPTATPPLFNGTDNPSCAYTSGTFVAALSGGSFTSPSPGTTANPVSLDFKLVSGTSSVTLRVLNARLSFATDATGNIQFGQINGSIPHSDIMNNFLPALDATCNTSIQSDPSSNFATSCKNVFDNGCNGSPGLAGDGQIELCEITENALLQSLSAPDVLVADGGSNVDANSMGIRFTAIAYDRVFANSFEP